MLRDGKRRIQFKYDIRRGSGAFLRLPQKQLISTLFASISDHLKKTNTALGLYRKAIGPIALFPN